MLVIHPIHNLTELRQKNSFNLQNSHEGNVLTIYDNNTNLHKWSTILRQILLTQHIHPGLL